MKQSALRLLPLFALFLPISGHSLTIVNMSVQFDGSDTDTYFEIYDEQTPINAANFLGYVNRGDWDESFFHRQAFTGNGEPFVLQGGGFTYIPEFDADAVFCRQAFGGGVVEASDPVTGELGLRPFDEIYFVDGYDASGFNVPDDIPDSPANNPGPSDGLVGAGLQAANDCTQVGDIYRINSALQYVPVDSVSLPVTSEAGIGLSNLKGTIAMALTAAGADSATNQWFINMKDNTQLDTQNGGFTVFGRLLGSSVDFFDTVMTTALPDAFFSQITGAFSDLPLVDHEQFTRALDENLVKITSADRIFNIDTTDHDFGYVPVAGNGQVVITLSVDAAWSGPVIIDQVEDSDSLAAPYTLVTDCEAMGAGATVDPGNSCTITIDIDPTTQGRFDDSFDISFTQPPIPPITISIDGTSQDLPRLVASEDLVNFEFLFPGLTKNRTVELTNIGQQTLNFNSFSLDNTTEFSFSDNCPASLASDESCELTLTFQPQSSGIKLGLLSIDSNGEDAPNEILLVGAGSGDVIPDIEAPDSLEMGDTFSDILQSTIQVNNNGGTELTMSSLNITGPDAAAFAVEFTDCFVLQVSEQCDIVVSFTPLTLGEKSAVLTITSDDPDEQQFEIQLSGSRSADNDKVRDSVEQAGPNAGDGDNDGVDDELQSNVVSLPGENGDYLSLVVSALNAFSRVELVDTPDPDSLPSDANPEFGTISFVLEGDSTFSSLYDIAVYLPAGTRVNKVFMYGPTSDDTTPHWFEVSAQLLNDVQIENSANGPVTRSLISLTIGDGFSGDEDLLTNNVLVGRMAVSVTSPQASSSSLGLPLLLLVPCVLLLRRRLTG